MSAQSIAELQNRREQQYKILEKCVETIIKSHLLLNEDEEVVLSYWSPVELQGKTRYSLYASVSVAMIGLGIYVLNRTPIYPILATTPTCLYALKYMTDAYRKWKQVSGLENIIAVLRKQRDLNRNIHSYFSKRHAVTNDLRISLVNDLLVNLMRDQEWELIYFAVDKVKELMTAMQECICLFTRTLKLKEMYTPLSKYRFDELHIPENATLEDMVKLLDHMQNLYILMTSNFLGSFGLVLCTHVWKEDGIFMDILKKVITSINKVLKVTAAIETKYNKLRLNLSEGPKMDISPSTELTPRTANYLKHLQECMGNIQVTFDMATNLNYLLERNPEPNLVKIKEFVDTIMQQHEMATRSIYILLKKSTLELRNVKNAESDRKEDVREEARTDEATRVVRFDDPELSGEDEEYSAIVDDNIKDENQVQISSMNYERLKEFAENQKCMISELNQRLHMIKMSRNKNARQKYKQDVTMVNELDSALVTEPNFATCKKDLEAKAGCSPTKVRVFSCSSHFAKLQSPSRLVDADCLETPMHLPFAGSLPAPPPPPLPLSLFEENAPIDMGVTTIANSVAAIASGMRQSAKEEVYKINSDVDSD